ncbi:nucleotidyltransferase family protein [Palleronia sp. KMU-117]|uniref:nucleotidyltransferase family protein n=1 Tax=Palleronia sp. KMU-117 TaxID=3434108 RepID=UPI003D70FDA6
MGALTAARPKPLIEVAGVTLLDRARALAHESGHSPVVVNTHYKAEAMARHLAGTDVRLSPEAPRILDTGGGLRHALPLLGDGPVATLNPDCVWSGPNPLRVLEGAWDPARMGALLLVVPLGRSHAHEGTGDFDLADDGRLRRKGPYVYTGAQILDPAGLGEIADEVFSLNLLWNRLATERRLFGVVYPGRWCDVGHPAGIQAAEALLGQGPGGEADV